MNGIGKINVKVSQINVNLFLDTYNASKIKLGLVAIRVNDIPK